MTSHRQTLIFAFYFYSFHSFLTLSIRTLGKEITVRSIFRIRKTYNKCAVRYSRTMLLLLHSIIDFRLTVQSRSKKMQACANCSIASYRYCRSVFVIALVIVVVVAACWPSSTCLHCCFGQMTLESENVYYAAILSYRHFMNENFTCFLVLNVYLFTCLLFDTNNNFMHSQNLQIYSGAKSVISVYIQLMYHVFVDTPKSLKCQCYCSSINNIKFMVPSICKTTWLKERSV